MKKILLSLFSISVLFLISGCSLTEKLTNNSEINDQLALLQLQMSGLNADIQELKEQNNKLIKENETIKSSLSGQNSWTSILITQNEELKKDIEKYKQVLVKERLDNKETNDISTKVVNDIKQRTEYINFFLVWPLEDDMSWDISRYLKSVKIKIEDNLYTLDNKIKYALESMMKIKTVTYEYKGNILENMLYASNLNVENITTNNGVTTIELKWKLIWASIYVFSKMQIEETINNYTKNYIIKLNGSEKEWRCSLDNSGLCQ